MAWGHVRSPARSDKRRAGILSPDHMTNAKSRRNQANLERYAAQAARSGAALADVQAAAPNAPAGRPARAAASDVAPSGRDAAGSAAADDAVSLRTLDARLAKHIAAFETGATPRAWHLAAARGLYSLIGEAISKGADPSELTMLGAPHWLLYSDEQVMKHAEL